MWPPGWVYFGDMGIILTNLVEGLLDDNKYQLSRLYAKWFQTRRFVMCTLYKPTENM